VILALGAPHVPGAIRSWHLALDCLFDVDAAGAAAHGDAARNCAQPN
jgi:hypothetical protein